LHQVVGIIIFITKQVLFNLQMMKCQSWNLDKKLDNLKNAHHQNHQMVSMAILDFGEENFKSQDIFLKTLWLKQKGATFEMIKTNLHDSSWTPFILFNCTNKLK
jgi:hypothetical protein